MHGEGRSGQRRVRVMLQPVSITGGGGGARLLLSHTFIKEDNEAATRADASF